MSTRKNARLVALTAIAGIGALAVSGASAREFSGDNARRPAKLASDALKVYAQAVKTKPAVKSPAVRAKPSLKVQKKPNLKLKA